MSVNVPVEVVARDHFHVVPLTVPSGSVSIAVSVCPPFLVPMIATVPASSTLVTETVTASVASIDVSVVPSLALPSLTCMVTS